MGIEDFDESVVGNVTILREDIHAFGDKHIIVIFVGEFMEMIVWWYDGWDSRSVDKHVFGVWNIRMKVEVFDVNGEEMGRWSLDNTI